MSDMMYLTVAYLGMIGGIALWTWTVFSRSKKLEEKIASLERILGTEATGDSQTLVEGVSPVVDDTENHED
tara:strand:- start:102 stop:314 length:213 start_codon:yes stop_codon:yes gene_type:complete